MTRQHQPHSQPTDSRVYEIRVGGHLGSQWIQIFEGVDLQLLEDGTTLLTCPAADQAALHGLLRKVRDLGLTLLAVNLLPAERD